MKVSARASRSGGRYVGQQIVEQRARLHPAGRVEAVAHARAVDLALHQPGRFQLFEVLRDGALRQRQLLHDVAADARLAGGQQPQNRHAGGVAEGFGDGS